jgi:hypothetical protein
MPGVAKMLLIASMFGNLLLVPLCQMLLMVRRRASAVSNHDAASASGETLEFASFSSDEGEKIRSPKREIRLRAKTVEPLQELS